MSEKFIKKPLEENFIKAASEAVDSKFVEHVEPDTNNLTGKAILDAVEQAGTSEIEQAVLSPGVVGSNMAESQTNVPESSSSTLDAIVKEPTDDSKGGEKAALPSLTDNGHFF